METEHLVLEEIREPTESFGWPWQVPADVLITQEETRQMGAFNSPEIAESSDYCWAI